MAPFAAALIAAAIAPFASQPVVVGPFKVGDLILSDPKENWLVKDLTDGGLDVDEVRKQMNGWNLSIIDYKSRLPDKTWTWRRPDKGDWPPKVVVEGRLSIEVKNKQGENIEIALAMAKAIGTDTDLSVSPASVRCPIVVTLRFHGLAVGEPGGVIHRPKEGAIELPTIRYDLRGRTSIDKAKQ